MATKPTLPSALKELEQQLQQLTCPVCLDIYTNPKSLPCLHSCCQHCLEGLPVNFQGNKYFIKCPTCSTSTELPEPTGPAAFPVAFHINSLKEIYSLKKKVTEPQQVICDVCIVANANGYCKDCNQFLCQSCHDTHKKFGNHQLTSLDEVATSASQLIHGRQKKAMNCSIHDRAFKIFCETCEELICRDCTIGDHKNHDCTPIKDSYDKHCQELETSLNPVNKMMNDIVNVLTALTKRENEVKKLGDMVKQEIHVMVEKMIEKLRQSERQLTREVETATDSKLQVLSAQKKSAEMSLSQLKDCKEFVEQSLKTGSHQQVLMSKKQMMEHMSHVTKEIKVEEYNPIEKADIRLIKNNKMELSIGNIVCTTALQQCKVKKIDRHQITCEKERVSFPLSLELPNSSSLLTIPLSSLSCSVVSTDNTPINTTVTTTDHPGVYRIHCSPVMNGPHQVNVQVNNVQLESTSLMTLFNPYLAKHTSIRTIDGLNRPTGVAVSDNGHVIVTECYYDCITVLDREGKKLKSFTSSGNIKFFSPHSVAITPDNFILVTDKHKIQKLTMDGKLIASVGQQGSKPLEFNVPIGIAISPTTGHIYVADCYNHRIQVLNPDFTFSYSFGSKGSAEGQFSSPRFIAIDNQGLVYVSDRYNHRIQVLTSEGKYISKFGTHGFGPGQLQSPTGLVINNNLLYVAECNNHCVSIFTTDGQFVSSFGEFGNKKDQFSGPIGITLDNEGYLYICDRYNNRLVMY